MADEPSPLPRPKFDARVQEHKNKWYSFTPWIENGEVAAIVKQKAR